MTALIRRATLDDIGTLWQLEQTCFQTDRLSLARWRYMITKAKASVLIVEESGEVAGSAVLLQPKAPRPARLYSLAVFPAHQKKGLAQALLSHCESLASASKRKFITLEAREENSNLIRFYNNVGYLPVKVLPDYYEDGASALRMKKTL